MSKQTVRILVEDTDTKEIRRYVSFEVDSAAVQLEVEPCFNAMQVLLSTYHADQVLQTSVMDVVLLDMAIALYESYRLADVFADPWGSLSTREKNAWIAVAKRRGHLAIVLDTPQVKQSRDDVLDPIRKNAIAALRNGTTIAEVVAALIDSEDDKTIIEMPKF